ncbi:peptidoglycan-binding protein [Streptomyces sp. NBC_00343]|uniref:peptidoglycan-binding protein n=1 Tax=Streptomyces sp. NBC_00343 TaxID=2975719 RepID=UPI002E290F50|nr:peptidoglycan-binding protein [Streptomyces sp. NBC_00343]
MPDLWLPDAERLPIGNTAPTDGGPAKAIGHITWDENATKAKPLDLVPYAKLRTYFGSNAAGRAVAPHLLWDPFTGKTVQFFPANSRSLSLKDLSGGTRTNRAGSVVLQIEALFFPWCRVGGKVYESLDDTPGNGWDELHAWVKSWGVPDVWPNGRPENCTRNEQTWETKTGWYPHKGVPENDHTDPMSWFAFPVVKPSTGTSGAKTYEAFPGASWFSVGRTSPVVGRMHDRLVAEGCGKYQSSANKNTIGSGDVASYQAFQRKLGFTGTAATWPPGKASWEALHVPKA